MIVQIWLKIRGAVKCHDFLFNVLYACLLVLHEINLEISQKFIKFMFSP
jgi:hypothetical protein